MRSRSIYLPSASLGIFATAVCLAQAGIQKRPPLRIAGDLKSKLDKVGLPFIREITVTPPGYLNFKIDHPRYVKSVMDRVAKDGAGFGRSNVGRGRKILIEHTNVNPNKAMHIGHLRNAIIGDSVVRVMERLGYNVEACNYIDDTGVQVADVVVAMLYMDEPVYDGKSDDMSAIWAKYDPSRPFDYWCWDVYTRIARAYETDEALKAKRAQVLHAVEAQDGAIANFAKEVATRIVRAHLATVGRLNVYYDLLNWESDIFLRGFWKAAFESLKEAGAIVKETEGPNAGSGWSSSAGASLRPIPAPKARTKSWSGPTARSLTPARTSPIRCGSSACSASISTTKFGETSPMAISSGPRTPAAWLKDQFGHADKVINVIDVRQSYTQQIVYDCLKKLGFRREAKNSIHLDYEVVVLSNGAAAELGVDVDGEEPGMQAMSGRKGLGVKGDDLIDTMVKRLSEKVDKPQNAQILAAAAIRYFMSRFSTGKIIVFDFDEALRTTGDTGVYCEYAHARACSILAKAAHSGFGIEMPKHRRVEIPERVTLPEENLIKKIAELPNAVRRAGLELSPAPLAHYAFELATLFTEFYETPDPDAEKQVPFIKIEDPTLRAYRLALVDTFRQAMANCLNSLGIIPLERI